MHFIPLFAQSYYYAQDSSTYDSDVSIGLTIFILVITIGLTLIAYVITSYLLSRIFKKAGVESWKAWVPVYNNWIFLELGGQKGFWAVLSLIPVVNIVSAIFMFIAMYHIGLNFGKEGAFVLFAILLPLVWYIWLAFDNSTWKGAHPVAVKHVDTPDALDKPVDETKA